MSNLRLPPLNAVRAFDAAARLGSYVEAAKALHVTQPAVGRHVKLLEDWLGVQLFERTSRGVVLTPAGRKYHLKISRALQQIIDAGEALQPQATERWLRIRVVPGLAKRWLTPQVESLRHLRPGLKVAIEPNSTFTDVDARTADLGIVYGMPGQYANSRATLICPRVFPICTPKYLASIPPIRRPQDLMALDLIHFDDGEWWNMWFKALGIEAQLSSDVLYVSNDHALAVAESGQGIALANEVLVRDELRAGTLVRAIDVEVALESYQLLTPSGHMSADVQWFEQWLGDALRGEFPGAFDAGAA
ncbi:LysR family transcriptional regulator [Pseudomonas sp. M47T1]|uniref:LysR substrate-binding domain-containing protein n=1 Tax=unclassified Pseudomonas TaxID=196821 RepID=UPI0002607911|nr:LysR substrate-binding domain-containing protein [Pseudomonas sp. M47T1]EIK94321.1 LysR family transcriptional regulator [Pseudomonas sp. M47T1]